MGKELMRSPLGRALGLGSAKHGVEQWRVERVTAIALVPLTVWFAASIVVASGGRLSIGRPSRQATMSISAERGQELPVVSPLLPECSVGPEED